jgi:plasmid stability protein
MASLLVRKLNDRVEAKLRLRAARHGRSMEEEARMILTAAVAEKTAEKPRNLDLAEAIHRRFARLGGVELELLPRTPVRVPPDFRD